MKNRPVTLNEGRRGPAPESVEARLTEAHRLRSAELARLFGALWNAPGGPLRRSARRPATASPTRA